MELTLPTQGRSPLELDEQNTPLAPPREIDAQIRLDAPSSRPEEHLGFSQRSGREFNLKVAPFHEAHPESSNRARRQEGQRPHDQRGDFVFFRNPFLVVLPVPQISLMQTSFSVCDRVQHSLLLDPCALPIA
ncbi:hypothetical protein D3C78_1489250 [compost metagenome]